MARYGKRINTQKKYKNPPSTQVSGMDIKSLHTLKRLAGVKFKNKKNLGVQPNFLGDGTYKNPALTATYGPSLSNPFYNYLLSNCITRTKSYINSSGASIGFDIIATGRDFMLRKGDSFYIYDPYTFFSKKLTCDVDLLGTATNLRFTSTTFNKGKDKFSSGSFILADNKEIVERANNSLQYKKIELSNADYKNMGLAPQVLLSGESNRIHLPVSCYIQYIHSGDDEMTVANLYIGHTSGSTTVGNYWGSIKSAFYRARNSLLFQIGGSTYAAGTSANYATTPMKSSGDDASGDDLLMYTSTNFTSASSTINVHLWYKTIGN